MTCRSLWILAVLIVVIVGVYLPLEALDGDDQDGFQEAALHHAAGHRRPGAPASIATPDVSRSVAMRGWTSRDDARGVAPISSAPAFDRHAEQLRASRWCARARLDEPATPRMTAAIEARA